MKYVQCGGHWNSVLLFLLNLQAEISLKNILFAFFSAGSYMYTGDLDGLYHDREMTSPTFQIDKPMCVEFFYVFIRTHEYSSTFLTIHQNTTYKNNEVFSLVEYRTNVSNQWQRGIFPVDVGIISLRFTAGGHRSVVAIDDVLLKDRIFCSSEYLPLNTLPFLISGSTERKF